MSVREAAPAPDVFDPRRYAAGVPYADYRVLRDEHPVAWQDEPEVLGWPAGPGFWAVTRHADVVRVLKDSATYSSYIGATQIRDPDPDDLPFIRSMMLNQDPPQHGRLRRLVSRAFTPGRVDRFAAVARGRARTLLARARDAADAGDGTVDLVGAVTDEYALLNLADLLGVPESDRRLLLHWTQRVIGYQDPDEAGTPTLDGAGRPVNPRSPAMLRDMFAYARQLAAYKRRYPADDVMTTLAHDAELGSAELEMFFFLLTVAGNDTVRGAAPAACSHWRSIRGRTISCAPARRNSAPRWTSCCAGTHRCCPSAGRPSGTPSWPGGKSARATRSWCSTPRPTGTSGSSRHPTGSTSPARPTRTSPSGTARTCAWAPTSPGSSYGCSTRRYCARCPRSARPGRRGDSSPTSSTASSHCP